VLTLFLIPLLYLTLEERFPRSMRGETGDEADAGGTARQPDPRPDAQPAPAGEIG
jgi:hypothetical protein